MMEPNSKDLDEMTAVHVMGWKMGEHPELHGTGQWFVEYEEPVYYRSKVKGDFIPSCNWEPRWNMEHAWRIIEKLKEEGWKGSAWVLFNRSLDEMAEKDGYMGTPGIQWLFLFCKDTMEAICKASLKAVGVEEE